MDQQAQSVPIFSSFSSVSWTPFDIFPFFFNPPAVKGMTYQTLVRLGLLWAEGPGAYDRGNFKGYYNPKDRTSGWGLKEPHEIQDLHDRLCEKLRAEPFGPFDALVLLVGDKNAREFIKERSEIIPRRGVQVRKLR